MYNAHALLKPCSRSAVTSPFFLTLAQGISRGDVEKGHNIAGDQEIDEIPWDPREKGSLSPQGYPGREQAGFVLWSCEVEIQPLTAEAGGLWPQKEDQVSTWDAGEAPGPASSQEPEPQSSTGRRDEASGWRLSEAEDGGPCLPCCPGRIAACWEPGHGGEKAEVHPALGWFPHSQGRPKACQLWLVWGRGWGQGSWGLDFHPVPERGGLRMGLTGFSKSTPNGQLNFAAAIWL